MRIVIVVIELKDEWGYHKYQRNFNYHKQVALRKNVIRVKQMTKLEKGEFKVVKPKVSI